MQASTYVGACHMCYCLCICVLNMLLYFCVPDWLLPACHACGGDSPAGGAVQGWGCEGQGVVGGGRGSQGRYPFVLLLTNLTNTNWCKKPEKWLKPRHMDTHLSVLRESFPINTSMTGFRWFSKIFASLCCGKSSLSIGKGNPFMPNDSLDKHSLDIECYWK